MVNGKTCQTKEAYGTMNDLEENGKTSTSGLDKAKGIFAVVIVLGTTSTSMISVQLLERRIPDFELNLLRSLTVAAFSLAGLILRTTWPKIPRDLILSTFCYGCLNFALITTRFIAVTLLPAATVQSIVYTARTLSGLVLFAIFCEEQITVKRVVLGMLCVCGVILIIQPDFLFPGQHVQHSVGCLGNLTDNNLLSDDGNTTMATSIENTKDTSFVPVASGYVLSLVSGVTTAMDIALLKKYPSLNDHKLPMLFWCFILGTILSFVPMAIFETPVLPSNWFDAGMIAAHCLSLVLYWPLYMFSVKLVSGNVYNLIRSLDVVILLIAQYTILSSILPGHRNWIEVVGATLVVLGSAIGSIMEMRKA